MAEGITQINKILSTKIIETIIINFFKKGVSLHNGDVSKGHRFWLTGILTGKTHNLNIKMANHRNDYSTLVVGRGKYSLI